MDTLIIPSILEKLENYIIKEEYKGYDPYDVLNSPIFTYPLLKTNKLLRFGVQQVFRRIPWNFRPLLGIKKEINPVTLGLCIHSFTFLSQIYPQKKNIYKTEIDSCIDKLVELKSDRYSGYCWGYNFDWEARYSKINKFVPTVVATGIITNSLFNYYQFSHDEEVKNILISSGEFVLKDLNRSYEDEFFSFSYSPNDYQKVYNATMKGARLLAQAYSLTKEKIYLEEAEKTTRFVCNNQQINGSWFYSKGDDRNWVDNFHTAYILDSLQEFINLSGKKEYEIFLLKGTEYYLNNLFTIEGFPKYYSHSFYPIDATEVAQSIITLTHFGYLKKAEKIIEFAVKNLYSSQGYFYYRKWKMTDKTPYIRWSIAWFFLALSYFQYTYLNTKDNL